MNNSKDFHTVKDLKFDISKLQESLKKVLEELVLKYPEAKIVGHYDLDKHKTCPNFNVQEYLLNEDIPNYKFQDGLTNEADLEELRDDGVI